MPGVIVQTETRSGPVGSTTPPAAAYFAVGMTERGSTDEPTRIRSMSEFDAFLGGRVPYGALYDDLALFFEEGGAEAYIARVVGPAATKGTVILKNRATSPQDAVTVSAANAGAWSSRLGVRVQAGSLTGTFKFGVYLDGALVAEYDNLTSIAELVSLTRRSVWVRLTSLGASATGDDALPAVTAGITPLTAGSDDRGSVTTSHVVAALTRLEPKYGAGAVAAPGYAADVIGAALIAHAQAHNRVALLATEQGATIDEALTLADDLVDDGHEWAGLFYPWVVVPDGRATRTISPEGYVAAMRARAQRLGGAWTVPAGDVAQARYVVEPEVELSKAQGDRLDEGRVSVIRTVAGTTRLYGWRSLSANARDYALLNGRDLLNYLALACEEALEPFVFATIDGRGQLLSRIGSVLVGVLEPIRQAGGLYERIVNGEEVDPGYSVDVGPAVNTDESLERNEVRARIVVRNSPTGQTIALTIVKAGFTASV